MDELLCGTHIFAGYGQGDVLRDVSVTLRTGELCAVLGENGSGKSTLLRTVCGLLPFRGRLTLGGSPLDRMDRRELARQVGYLSQRSRVALELSAMEIVLMGFNPVLGLFRSPGKGHRGRAAEVLEWVGAEELAEQPYQSLSEGQKQLVLIARTLVRDPALLVLDEPDSALDFRNRGRLPRLLRELPGREKRGILLCSHDVNTALLHADRMLLLRRGRERYDIAVADAPREELAAALRDIYGPVELLRHGSRYLMTEVGRDEGTFGP